MNKIAQYLNEHILGEVVSAESVRKRFSRDGSILSIVPEMVAHPRVTNDIRKIARFTWQLAEKGHIVPLTVRGGGSDQTGAAIGKGIIINTLAHLDNIIFINPKSQGQSVHIQPGVNFSKLNDVIKTHGMIIPTAPKSAKYSTVGGAIANNSGGISSGKYGRTGDYVTRLEVVLANGDVIETARISKRELSKKKGLQTLEGEIYRKIDAIIEDNQQLINSDILPKANDNCGYSNIAKVRRRDGSFDLTPLFIGSQGTLGIISEIVMKSEYYSGEDFSAVATFSDASIARNAADSLSSIGLDSIEYIESSSLQIAKSLGKKYSFIGDSVNALLVMNLSESGRSANRKIKQITKKLSKFDCKLFTSEEHPMEEINAIGEVSAFVMQPDDKEESAPPLVNGSSIPSNNREEFLAELSELINRHHVVAPIRIGWLNNVIHIQPILRLHHLSDKQKTLKLISEYAELVTKFGGDFCNESSEGRLKANAAYDNIDSKVIDIYDQIRTTFDPFGTLNPDVKQKIDLKKLITALDSDYSLADFSQFSPN